MVVGIAGDRGRPVVRGKLAAGPATLVPPEPYPFKSRHGGEAIGLKTNYFYRGRRLATIALSFERIDHTITASQAASPLVCQALGKLSLTIRWKDRPEPADSPFAGLNRDADSFADGWRSGILRLRNAIWTGGAICALCLVAPAMAASDHSSGDGSSADNERLLPGVYPADPVLANGDCAARAL